MLNQYQSDVALSGKLDGSMCKEEAGNRMSDRRLGRGSEGSTSDRYQAVINDPHMCRQ